MPSFQAALARGDLDALRRLPKSDLHNHFFLGGNRALVSEWAGRDIAPLDRKLASMADAGVSQYRRHPDVRASVSDEFLNLYRAGLFNAAELDRIRLNGLSDDP